MSNQTIVIHTMYEKYLPFAIESAAQDEWCVNNVYRSNETTNKPKFYCVSMLPYPSGKLHMGHVRNYTINDMMYRYLRMNGYNVLMPMGWDAFGMPAENAAIANAVSPAIWTYNNIAYMKRQMQSMGFAIDWSREITTCKPDYYKWNQWLFIKMLERNIVYKKTGIVNWDPVDQTVLANEQVIDGRGWRSGVLVENREIPMYYMRITQYANKLLKDLEILSWPERVKIMQQNWIGKRYGVNLGFPYEINGDKKLLRVFTTRLDTIMGVTFCAIAVQHPLAQCLAQDRPDLLAFIEEYQHGSVAEGDLVATEKRGIATGLFVTHPLTNDRVEVWISNYVLMSYGEGAVMGVPAHNRNDFAFAKKYGLPIKQVIVVPNKIYSTDVWQTWYSERKVGTCTASGKYDGMKYTEAVDAILKSLRVLGLGHKQVVYRLRDWGISRQRYWGTPIPIIHCPSCGDVPVPEKDLPVILPENLMPNGASNPLTECEAFVNCTCPRCNSAAKRETDTMDTFVDSSWYFSRYPAADATTMIDARTDYWMPIDQYIGGIEHATLHLLYSRFWTKVMCNMGLVKFSEPTKNLLTQGMVLNETYYRNHATSKKTWYSAAEVKVTEYDKKRRPISATLIADGKPVIVGDVEKMSKSKNNGVDPQALIDQFGADTTRLFIISAAPPEQQLEWSNTGIAGANRFLHRLWTFGFKHITVLQTHSTLDTVQFIEADKKLRREIYCVLKQANFDYQRLQYNTVVSAAIKMLNALEGANDAQPTVLREAFGILLRVLHPVVPHVTHRLWQELEYVDELGTLLDAPWPKIDEKALEQANIELVLQINGKVRGTFTVPKETPHEIIKQIALAHEIYAQFGQGKLAKRVVIVPGRLVNIVV